MAPSLITLPVEIKHKIAGFLAGEKHSDHSNTDGLVGYKNDLAGYATISKEWQDVFESFTFQAIKITVGRIPDAMSFITPKRLKYLERIVLRVALHPGVVGDDCYLENRHKRACNSRVFDHNVSTLFNSLLGAWKWEQVKHGGITLQMSVSARTDGYLSREPMWYQRFHGDPENYNMPIGVELYQDSFLDLSTPLSQVECVSSFQVGDLVSTRNLSGTSYWSLLRALPRLQALELQAPEITEPVLSHREAYIGFLAAVPSSSLRSLCFSIPDSGNCSPCPTRIGHRELYLEYYRDSTNEHGLDALSSMLREVSQGLTTLQIIGPVGLQFFWPLAGSKGSETTPNWPHMKSICANIYPYQPGGTMFFDHAECRSHTQMCIWKPNQDAHDALYSAIAKGVSRMPKLEVLALRVNAKPVWHEFRFRIVGRHAYLCWSSLPFFKPSEEVLRLWQDVANTRDLELVVVFRHARPSEKDYAREYHGEKFIMNYENDGFWDVLSDNDHDNLGGNNEDGDDSGDGDDEDDDQDNDDDH